MPSIPRAVRSGAIFTAIGVYLPCRSASAFCSAFSTPSRAVAAFLRLQLAQPSGVRRRNVDGDIRCARIDRAQAGNVVVRGPRVRGVEVLADVEAEDAVATTRATRCPGTARRHRC